MTLTSLPIHMLKKYTFKEKIEESFKTEVAEQLRLKNIVIINTHNQRFEVF